MNPSVRFKLPYGMSFLFFLEAIASLLVDGVNLSNQLIFIGVLMTFTFWLI